MEEKNLLKHFEAHATQTITDIPTPVTPVVNSEEHTPTNVVAENLEETKIATPEETQTEAPVVIENEKIVEEITQPTPKIAETEEEDEIKEYKIAKKENPELTLSKFLEEKNFDPTKLSALEQAREKAMREKKGITKENVDAYLSKKTGVIIDEETEIDEFDELELKEFVGDYFDKKENPTKKTEESTSTQDDFIELPNGAKMPKKQFEEYQYKRKDYIEKINNSVANSKEDLFSVKIDDNGIEKTIDLTYSFSEKDKQQMLSNSTDIEGTINKLFKNEKGEVNYDKLAKSVLWLDESFRTNAINAIVKKGIAHALQENLKQEYNPNFAGFKQPTNPNFNKQTNPIRMPGTLQMDMF